jgi:hypothetical protein
MGAPEGNQFWKLRSKHGRDKLFETPQLMWEAACEYFEWCESNPLIEVDFKGKDADEVHIPKMRAFTIQGLSLYMDCNSVYFAQFKDSIKEKEDDLSKGFSNVITRIYEIIYTQKFTGAAAGFLNPNIIARDLGLKDQSEVKGAITQINYNTEITKDEAKNISDALEKDV